MKLASKILLFILLLIITSVIGIWYYLNIKIAQELNAKLAGRQFTLKLEDDTEYLLSVDKIKSSGSFYNLSWDAVGFVEDSKNAKIAYTSPIYFGYDLLSQRIFINYDGEIKAAYKPLQSGFGALLKVKDYKVLIDFPLTKELVNTLSSMQDAIELINHVGGIHISTGKVEIFDLVDNEKFYDKDLEDFKLRFVPARKYENIEEFINNIPKNYAISYQVKTNKIEAPKRRMPVILFYGFPPLPTELDVKIDADIQTRGNTIAEFWKGIKIKSDFSLGSEMLDITNFSLLYDASNSHDTNKNYKLNVAAQIKTKNGLFNQILEKYRIYYSALGLRNSDFDKIVDNELQYIMQNQEEFKIKDFENNEYSLKIDADSVTKNNKTYLKLHEFSLISNSSGIRIKHDMESKNMGGKWSHNSGLQAEGMFYVQNYPHIIEFISAYINRYGKFKSLNAQAKELYVEVNKAFLKSISDYPDSESNDLSFEYSLNGNIANAKFGTVKFSQLLPLYKIMLYQKLFDKVGYGGDILGRMRAILPDIDENEPLLKNILLRIPGDKSNE